MAPRPPKHTLQDAQGQPLDLSAFVDVSRFAKRSPAGGPNREPASIPLTYRPPINPPLAKLSFDQVLRAFGYDPQKINGRDQNYVMAAIEEALAPAMSKPAKFSSERLPTPMNPRGVYSDISVGPGGSSSPGLPRGFSDIGDEPLSQSTPLPAPPRGPSALIEDLELPPIQPQKQYLPGDRYLSEVSKPRELRRPENLEPPVGPRPLGMSDAAGGGTVTPKRMPSNVPPRPALRGPSVLGLPSRQPSAPRLGVDSIPGGTIDPTHGTVMAPKPPLAKPPGGTVLNPQPKLGMGKAIGAGLAGGALGAGAAYGVDALVGLLAPQVLEKEAQANQTAYEGAMAVPKWVNFLAAISGNPVAQAALADKFTNKPEPPPVESHPIPSARQLYPKYWREPSTSTGSPGGKAGMALDAARMSIQSPGQWIPDITGTIPMDEPPLEPTRTWPMGQNPGRLTMSPLNMSPSRPGMPDIVALPPPIEPLRGKVSLGGTIPLDTSKPITPKPGPWKPDITGTIPLTERPLGPTEFPYREGSNLTVADVEGLSRPPTPIASKILGAIANPVARAARQLPPPSGPTPLYDRTVGQEYPQLNPSLRDRKLAETLVMSRWAPEGLY